MKTITKFEKEDYRQLEDGETYKDKFVILDPIQFKEEYRDAKNCLYYAEGGFGCYPDKLGGKIFGRIFDESYQTRREYVLGVATENAIKKWEELYGMSREVFVKEDN